MGRALRNLATEGCLTDASGGAPFRKRSHERYAALVVHQMCCRSNGHEALRPQDLKHTVGVARTRRADAAYVLTIIYWRSAYWQTL